MKFTFLSTEGAQDSDNYWIAGIVPDKILSMAMQDCQRFLTQDKTSNKSLIKTILAKNFVIQITLETCTCSATSSPPQKQFR